MRAEWISVEAGINVYVSPISSGILNKREREKAAEESLLTQVFGRRIDLYHTPEGKPYLNENVQISLSHSKNNLALAVAGQAVGIDIEEVQERIARVKHKFFPDEIGKNITDLTELTILWSAKEAIYKIAGEAAGAIGQYIKIPISSEIFIPNQWQKAYIDNTTYHWQILKTAPVVVIALRSFAS